jgi:hypothetical protein
MDRILNHFPGLLPPPRLRKHQRVLLVGHWALEFLVFLYPIWDSLEDLQEDILLAMGEMSRWEYDVLAEVQQLMGEFSRGFIFIRLVGVLVGAG